MELKKLVSGDKEDKGLLERSAVVYVCAVIGYECAVALFSEELAETWEANAKEWGWMLLCAVVFGGIYNRKR